MKKFLALTSMLWACATWAEEPRVAVDIAPLHSLVATVMDGVGSPDLLMPPKTSVHGMSLRPSQARLLDRADLVVWIGPEFTPWFSRALSVHATDAVILEVLQLQGDNVLPFRETLAAPDDGNDGHDDHGHDDHDHDGHNDHGQNGHDDHGNDGHDGDTGHAGNHGHYHGDIDPHVWLDPEIARTWLPEIAETLAKIDPEHAARYRENAKSAARDLSALTAEITALLEDVRDIPYVTYHDAFQYFERRFGLTWAGSVRTGDAVAPGLAAMTRFREQLREWEVRCAFSEAQFNDELLHVAAEGLGLRMAEIDPLGANLTPGRELYGALLRNLATRVAGCLGA